MSDKLRLFVAVEIGERHKQALAALAGQLKETWPRARWVRPENRHVTLKFLGWTTNDRLPAIAAAVREVATSHVASELRMTSLGGFPSNRRLRVLWVGLDDPAGLLAALAVDLEGAFEKLGWAPENRPFRPHLTLARFEPPERAPGDLPDVGLGSEPPIKVDRLVLFRSQLHKGGARYEVLEEFPLS